MTKVLVINGSPRKKGNVATMLHLVADNIEGAEVHWFDVNDLKVHPCIGCMQCRSKRNCVLPEDDAHRMAEELKWCDALILGSPVYWLNISGQMKLLFDRLVYAGMKDVPNRFPIKLHKGKKAILVTACTTPWPLNVLLHQSTHTLQAMKDILNFCGFKMAGKVVLTGTDRIKDIPGNITKKCKKLARKL